MSKFAMPVSLYMSVPVHSIGPDERLDAVRKRIKQLGISCLGVTDGDGRLVGVISRTDLIRRGRVQTGTRPGDSLLSLPPGPVGQVMNKDVATVSPNDPVSRAAQVICERRVHRVFAVQDARPMGVLSTRDIMRALQEKRVNQPISRFMSSPVFTVRATEPISLATARLEQAHVSGLVVLDGKWPVGLFTQRDALVARHLPRETPVESVMNPALIGLNPDTPLHRAIEQAAALNARRILAVNNGKLEGILTGIDHARAAA
jgi:CBS domain-containing protein